MRTNKLFTKAIYNSAREFAFRSMKMNRWSSMDALEDHVRKHLTDNPHFQPYPQLIAKMAHKATERVFFRRDGYQRYDCISKNSREKDGRIDA